MLAIPELPASELPALDPLPAHLPALETPWRTEITRRGKYWQWRRGSGRSRQSRYGGKTELLPPERMKQYAINKTKKARVASTHPRRRA